MTHFLTAQKFDPLVHINLKNIKVGQISFFNVAMFKSAQVPWTYFYFQPKDLLKEEWDDLEEVTDHLDENGKVFSFTGLVESGGKVMCYGMKGAELCIRNTASGDVEKHAWCCDDDSNNFENVIHLKDYLVFQCIRCELVLYNPRKKEKIRSTFDQQIYNVATGQNNTLFVEFHDDKIIEYDCSNGKFEVKRKITKAKPYDYMCYIPSKDWLAFTDDKVSSPTIEAISCGNSEIVFCEPTGETKFLGYHEELNALIQCVVRSDSIGRRETEVRVLCLENGRHVKNVDLIDKYDTVYDIVVS